MGPVSGGPLLSCFLRREYFQHFYGHTNSKELIFEFLKVGVQDRFILRKPVTDLFANLLKTPHCSVPFSVICFFCLPGGFVCAPSFFPSSSDLYSLFLIWWMRHLKSRRGFTLGCSVESDLCPQITVSHSLLGDKGVSHCRHHGVLVRAGLM